MRKYVLLFFTFFTVATCWGGNGVTLPIGKSIYISKDLQDVDLQNSESKWSCHRMALLP